MNTEQRIFIAVLIVNTLIAIVYLLWGVLFHKKNDDGENRRIAYVLRAVCMFLCPVIGLLFFVVGLLLQYVFFHTPVDLEDVLFSKQRVRQMSKADVATEKNYVPIEEALKISDQKDLRVLMLNVLKGNIDNSLRSISLAMNSEDSETSHYAASLLSKALNEFRVNVKKVQQGIKEDMEENPEVTDKRDASGVLLVSYMDAYLMQHVFTNVEQQSMVLEMADVGEMVYQDEIKRREEEAARLAAMTEEEKAALDAQAAKELEEKNKEEKSRAKNAREQMEKLIEPMFRARGVETPEETPQEEPVFFNAAQIAEIVMRLLEVQAYDRAKVWCDRAGEEYPDALETYKCTLQLQYTIDDKQGFFHTLDRLKKSGIPIDNETMDIIRVF